MKKSKLLVLSLLAVSALGLTSCGSQGIQGEKGEPGIQGKQGEPGKDGKDGENGKDGKDGAPGKDGKDGKNGLNGADGKTAWSNTILYSEGGSIIPDKGSYLIGEKVTFTFTPNENYKFISATINQNEISKGYSKTLDGKSFMYQVDMISGGFVVSAKFSKESSAEEASVDYLAINNTNDFKAFRDNVNNGTNYKGQTIKIMNDLDFSSDEDGQKWIPIGIKSKSFAGTLDGNNHTIKGIKVANYEWNNNSRRYGAGLFNTLSAGSIKDLTLDSFSFNGTRYGNVNGLLAGYINGGANVTNVTIKDSYLIGFGKIGAIAGMATGDTTIKDCKIINTTLKATYNVGGLVGLVTLAASVKNFDISGNDVSGVKYVFDKELANASGFTAIFNDKINGYEGSYIKYLEKDYKDLYRYSNYSKYYNVYLNSSAVKGSEIAVNKEVSVKVYKDLKQAIELSNKQNDIHYGASDDSQGIYFDSETTRTYKPRKNEIAFITNWSDILFKGELTLEGFNFFNGARFVVNHFDKAVLNLKDCVFLAQDNSKLKNENIYKRTGDGLCINLENWNGYNKEEEKDFTATFNVESCASVGEDDTTKSTFDSKNTTKKRAHGLGVNVILGNNNSTTNVNYKNSSIAGVRGNAIQLYGKTNPLNANLENIDIYSYGVAKEVVGESISQSSYALRGDIVAGATLSLTNVNIHLDEKITEVDDKKYVLGHIKMEDGQNPTNYEHNSDGTQKAKIYNF